MPLLPRLLPQFLGEAYRGRRSEHRGWSKGISDDWRKRGKRGGEGQGDGEIGRKGALPWAPAGMGRGHLPPLEMLLFLVFCALAVTVKRSVDQLYLHYFHNFSPAKKRQKGHFCWAGDILRIGVAHLAVLACVLSATTRKGRQLFWGKKCTPVDKILATPMNLPTPVKNPAGAHGPSPAVPLLTRT